MLKLHKWRFNWCLIPTDLVRRHASARDDLFPFPASLASTATSSSFFHNVLQLRGWALLKIRHSQDFPLYYCVADFCLKFHAEGSLLRLPPGLHPERSSRARHRFKLWEPWPKLLHPPRNLQWAKKGCRWEVSVMCGAMEKPHGAGQS